MEWNNITNIIFHWLYYNTPSHSAFHHLWMVAEFERSSLQEQNDPVLDLLIEGSSYVHCLKGI